MILYLNEEEKKVIFEGIVDKTYHFCSLGNCLNILRDGRLGCTMSTNKSDAYHKTKLFYVSTQRSKHPKLGYASVKSHKGRFSIARIELNGYLLKQDGYEGKPLDYWGSMGKQSDIGASAQRVQGLGANASPKDILKAQQNTENFEYEDRIFSDKPYLPSKYISRVDILLQQACKEAKECIVYGEKNGISVNVYENEKDFILQTNNTSNKKLLEAFPNDGNYDSHDKNSDIIDYKILFKLIGIYIFDDVWKNGFSDSVTKKLVSDVLDKYGFGFAYSYFEENLSEFYSYNLNGSNVRDNAFSFSNNYGLRKMINTNSGSYAEKMLLLAQDTLRKYGVNNFDELGTLFVKNKTTKEEKKQTQEFVPCIKYYRDYENNKFVIKRADKITLWDFINKDTFYENISNVIDEYDSSLYYANNYGWDVPTKKIFHKSKNNESFKKYLKHLTYNDGLSLYDGAIIVNNIFGGNLKEMADTIWVAIKPFKLTKEEYIKNEDSISSIDNYGEYGIYDSLFTDWDDYYNTKSKFSN